MKTIKIYLPGLFAIMFMISSQQAFGQPANFYSSTNYSNFVNNMISNSIWNSYMEKYTKEYKRPPDVSKSSYTQTSPPEIPEYRRYPAVQFKPSGTRLTLQEYLEAVQLNEKEKEELKELILQIFAGYEAEAAAKGYPNDRAFTYVSYVGINSHIYYGKTEALLIPYEQNVGLRDIVAEYATDNDIFNGVSDEDKQELYELLILMSGLTYHCFEKACKENNAEEIKTCRLTAEQNLKIIGIKL